MSEEKNEKLTSYEAPKSPRHDSAVITNSEDDAKALHMDAVYVSAPEAIDTHYAYFKEYTEVLVAIPDPDTASQTAICLRALDKHLPIAIVKKDAWKGAASVQDFMKSQNLSPTKAVEALGEDAEYIPDGGCYYSRIRT